MQALSIRQPWAWLILHGGKLYENRDWSPKNPGCKYRGEFWIHTGSGMTRAEYEDGVDTAALYDVTLPPFEELQRGGIVGRATVIDWVEDWETPHVIPYAFGPGLMLANPVAVDFIPCAGVLGFFEPDLVTPYVPKVRIPKGKRTRTSALRGEPAGEDAHTPVKPEPQGVLEL